MESPVWFLNSVSQWGSQVMCVRTKLSVWGKGNTNYGAEWDVRLCRNLKLDRINPWSQVWNSPSRFVAEVSYFGGKRRSHRGIESKLNLVVFSRLVCCYYVETSTFLQPLEPTLICKAVFVRNGFIWSSATWISKYYVEVHKIFYIFDTF